MILIQYLTFRNVIHLVLVTSMSSKTKLFYGKKLKFYFFLQLQDKQYLRKSLRLSFLHTQLNYELLEHVYYLRYNISFESILYYFIAYVQLCFDVLYSRRFSRVNFINQIVLHRRIFSF